MNGLGVVHLYIPLMIMAYMEDVDDFVNIKQNFPIVKRRDDEALPTVRPTSPVNGRSKNMSVRKLFLLVL